MCRNAHQCSQTASSCAIPSCLDTVRFPHRSRSAGAARADARIPTTALRACRIPDGVDHDVAANTQRLFGAKLSRICGQASS